MRHIRGPNDERDERDERRDDDPRDERDPRLPGDPRDAAALATSDAAEIEGRKSHFGRWLLVVIALGLAVLSFTSWQVRSLRIESERKTCERIVEARSDSRAVWLYLIDRDPDRSDDPDVVEFIEFFDTRLPPLECDGRNIPVPVDL